jgi:DNA-directed RNA polymerase specialized sigma24 family protein
MDQPPNVPSEEEIARTYRMVLGMAFRKQFRTCQDREDFVQEVMLHACRSYRPLPERPMSFKNFACGLVFMRQYQSYWRKFYGRQVLPGETSRRIVGAELGRGSCVQEPGATLPPFPDEKSGTDLGRSAQLQTGGEDSLRSGICQSLGDLDGYADETAADPVETILKRALVEEIEGLESPYAELMACFLKGMTRDEVACSMDKSVSWAKKYTLKALETLLKRLKTRGMVVASLNLEELLS